MPYQEPITDSKPSLREFLTFRANNRKHSNERVLNTIKLLLNRLSHYYKGLPDEDQRSIAINLEHYFESEYCKSWFLKNYQDKGIRLEKTAIRNFRNQKTKQSSRTHWKDLFALYSGFAGFIGYEERKTIYDCFEIVEHYETFKDSALLKYLSPPKISKREQQITLENTYDLFYEDYQGKYDIFFIEEQLGKDKGIRFGVSNFIIDYHFNHLFFMHNDNDRITKSSFMLMNESTDSTFFIREIKSDWGYLIGLPRPFQGYGNKKEDFFISYLGVSESSGSPFASIAYAMKIKEGHFTLPDRGFGYDSIDELRSWKEPMSSRNFNKKRQRRSAGFPDTYQDIKDSTKEINKDTQKRIKNVLEILEKIGKPLEIPEKV